MLINGQYPGPVIIANWGDYLQINVYNDMKDNGTGFHWHGLRQFNSNDQDGANGVTECPIPPGTMKSYAFQLSQYGTTWYHSHFSAQYGNGVFGSIQINGPASANYDVDLGPYVINDYYYETADNLARRAELVKNGPPPPSDNIIFNGSAKNPDGVRGNYQVTTLQPGKKHLVRIINTSVENTMTVNLQGHTFTVIATDLVPITPVTKNSLFLGIGQRYDVIIEANQPVGNYWFNATLGGGGLCGTSNAKFPAAIFRYSGAPASNPTSQGSPPANPGCVDDTGFTPIVARTAPQSQFNVQNGILDVVLDTPTVGTDTVFRWKVNGSSINVQWEKPILEYISQNNNSYPAQANIISIPQANAWTWWVVENTGFLPHPIHLHGHDFLLLGTGTGTFDPSNLSGLHFNNPTRRDVAMLPSNGWLALAFQTDNPGAWLMHCHIAWHVSQGLSVQFLERASEIAGNMHLNQIEPNCNAWRSYATTAYYPKMDSGL
jgi:FtsP/CotA-like multicopper oxidase with cupredoxin domain